ncbi:hypothetical protein EAF00_011824 [Botryotinia globosa]|nr:hypothetical protein EAF00_011824 [Botryotinia globosa]
MYFSNAKFLPSSLPLQQSRVLPLRRTQSKLVPSFLMTPSTHGEKTYLVKKFEPFLYIALGCQPYSAVDGNGNTSGGLQDTGNVSNGYRDQSKGRTYVRGGWSGGRYGIMYAWYFPKDQPAAGNVYVIAWINNPSVAGPALIGAAASGHGSGDRLKVEYYVSFATNHELQFTKTLVRDLPMMWYDFLPAVSKIALQNTNFGKASCPLNDHNFANNLAKAAI